jgi:putative exporter of polyketide antibiotics
MTDHVVIVAAGALLVLVLTELVAAALPVIIVIAMVPPEEREGLARLLAACDSSRKLRLWPAVRVAVRARREETRRTRAGIGH